MDQVKVLIIEDDPVQSLQMSRDLAKMNYQVVGKATNPQKAWDLLIQKEPDLALVDINLTGETGDKSGIELAKKIRSQFPIPFIYITALEDDATFQSAKSAKPQYYIVKPYRKEELYRAIELALINFVQVSNPSQQDDYIVVKDNLCLKKVFFKNITWIEADGALKKIHTSVSNHYETTWATMEELEEKLISGPFVRVHRSYIVNLYHIKQYKLGNVKVLDQEIPVGRSYKETLQNRLRALS